MRDLLREDEHYKRKKFMGRRNASGGLDRVLHGVALELHNTGVDVGHLTGCH